MEKQILDRNFKILNQFIGKTFYVHNGLDLKKLIVNKDMVGYKAGEFIYTKKMSNKIHNQKNKKKNGSFNKSNIFKIR